jgi:hypothetical protein
MHANGLVQTHSLAVFGAVHGHSPTMDEREPASSRDTLDRAQAMVSIQADCSLDEALELMMQVARAADESLEQVAVEIVNGNVRFDRG